MAMKKRFLGLAMAAMVAMPASSAYAVSYTHLDVYKRQLLQLVVVVLMKVMQLQREQLILSKSQLQKLCVILMKLWFKK